MSSPTAEHVYRPAMAKFDPERRARSLERWRLHSRRVWIARRALPALIVVLVLGLAVWAGVNTVLLRMSAASRIANMAIRMVNPKFMGRDQGGKPFFVGASLAVRDSQTPQIIYLQQPTAVLGSAVSDRTEANANRGVYREDTHMLTLDGNVHLRDATDDFVTSHAVANTATNDVAGQAHIDGAGAFGRVSSDAYAVHENGAHVFFYGHVKAHIIQSGSGGGALKGPR